MTPRTSNQTCAPSREVGRIAGALRHPRLETEPTEGLIGKRNYIFRWEFMLISICDCLFLCVPCSWYLYVKQNKTRFALRKDVCVFFCNFDFQISFSGNFWYATAVFHSEISHTGYSRLRKSSMLLWAFAHSNIPSRNAVFENC